MFSRLKWCANVWHLPLKSVAAVAKVISINDCEIRVLLIPVADELVEELVDYSELEELLKIGGINWMLSKFWMWAFLNVLSEREVVSESQKTVPVLGSA